MREALAKIVLLHICIVITGGFSIWCQKRWNSYPEIHLEKSEDKLLFFILCIVDRWTRSRKFTLVWTNLENLVERKKEKERKGADYFVIVRCFRWCRQHSYIFESFFIPERHFIIVKHLHVFGEKLPLVMYHSTFWELGESDAASAPAAQVSYSLVSRLCSVTHICMHDQEVNSLPSRSSFSSSEMGTTSTPASWYRAQVGWQKVHRMISLTH